MRGTGARRRGIGGRRGFFFVFLVHTVTVASIQGMQSWGWAHPALGVGSAGLDRRKQGCVVVFLSFKLQLEGAHKF